MSGAEKKPKATEEQLAWQRKQFELIRVRQRYIKKCTKCLENGHTKTNCPELWKGTQDLRTMWKWTGTPHQDKKEGE